MIKNIFSVIVIFLCLTSGLKAQESYESKFKLRKFKYDFLSDKIYDDTSKMYGKSKVQKVNIGGLFLSPNLGVAFPLGTFGNYSNSGFLYGAKFELAYSRLYPFVFGFVYESQKNKGNANFTTTNNVTEFTTKITYIGGSLDIILNKFVKSNFTIPVFSVEIKYAKVTRTITPESALPDIERQGSQLTYSAGLGFTIYVFDLSGKYTFSKDLTNLTFQMRLHLPIIRF